MHKLCEPVSNRFTNGAVSMSVSILADSDRSACVNELSIEVSRFPVGRRHHGLSAFKHQ
jgi:hypothetical protein